MRFSKGDLASASLTLIVTAVGYWVGGQKTAVIALAAGILLMLIARFMRGPHADHTASIPEKASNTVSNSANTSLNNVGNPRVEIHNYPPPIPTVAPVPKPEPVVKSAPKANICFKNVRAAWIWYDEKEDCFVEVQNGKSTPRGVIARFKNESAAYESGDARLIRAELVLRDANEQEMEQGIHAACWLREHADTVDFIVGEDHWLLLGAVDPGDNKTWLIPWKREKRTWEGTFYELEGHNITGLRSIEIRLIGESNRWVVDPIVVDVVLNGGEPTVAVRPPARR